MSKSYIHTQTQKHVHKQWHACNDATINLNLALSPPFMLGETIEFKKATGLSSSMMRTMNSFFQSKHLNILAPEYKVREELATFRHASECGGCQIGTEPYSFVRVSDVGNVIETEVAALDQNDRFYPHSNIPSNTLWLQIAGDKGGKTTKLTAQIINTQDIQSCKNIITLAVYEGPEKYEKCSGIFTPIFQELEDWSATAHIQLSNTIINSVDIFYGGDMSWLWLINGLSECGYHFCPMCLRTNDDRKAGVPHPGKRRFPKRTLESLHSRYNDYVNDGSDKKKAKLHQNVIASPLVRTDIADRIVPLPLHVLLGLVNDIVSMIEQECIQKDVLIKQKKGGVNIHHLKQRYDTISEGYRTIELSQQHIAQTKQHSNYLQQEMKRYKQQHQHALEYQNGRPKYFDKHSLIGRQPFMNMKIQKQQYEIWHLKQSIKEAQQKIIDQQQQLEELCGPFIVYFNRVLSSLKINRSDYHGRALIS